MDDKEYLEVRGAFEEQDYPRAFSLTHSIKGMCANMGFTRAFESASALCETVRHGAPEVDEFYEDYEFTREWIGECIVHSASVVSGYDQKINA